MARERKLGILGKKVGMTRIFDASGASIGVTVVEAGPCVVLGKRTKSANKNGRKDGYTALRLGFGNKAERHVNKPEAGTLEAAGGRANASRFVRELRVNEETLAKFELGAKVTLKDLGLKTGDLVDITGQSKGKGFQGVVRRHGMKGFPASHGTHEYFRHPGSIGNRKWPGRVFKGRAMPGHMGDERVTTQNVRIAQVREDDNVVLLWGSVPGAKGGYVVLRAAIKKHPNP